ncbi:endoplasmic reticulum mannosyl-oligosaccharide 1,2-alpha-mannosidase isoform X1 [Cimex lectularius]|uniref:alpha-1,2-Mannosidase n=1 Tax=Cimex lectularius TaxID=79782 RepID=A0A8I6TBW1_CIMLE|nr:endoplasmic reticulum mannosyl-oligosaccharide 1,2-alpha-mannosidase isoform X1 [Cimex lectularius]
MKDGHVLLALNNEQSFISSRRRWTRVWNRLSKLQRNILRATLFVLLLTVVYICVVTWSDDGQSAAAAGARLHKYEHLFDRGSDDVPPRFQRLQPHPEPAPVEVEAPVVDQVDIVNDDKSKENKMNDEIIPPVPTLKTERSFNISSETNKRQKAVIDAFLHAWNGYKKYAWGHDHLKPISHKPHDWFKLGLSIVDSLDTMYLMNLKEELAEARNWVENDMNMNEFNDVNLFEVTIRVLGGLLSAYHLTGDNLYLIKAKDLGERLLPCFTKSPSPIPFSDVNLASHNAHSPRWGPDSSTSEVTTLQLEFRDLSRATNDDKFEKAASRVSMHVHTLPKTEGLVPIFINPRTGLFPNYADIKLGARGDSYYEYLVKQWIQTGKTIDYLRNDYIQAINGINKLLVRRTPKSNLLFIGELKAGSREFVPKMDHLVCYLPGTLALGYHHGLPEAHLQLAQELLYTCYRTYADRPTFLAPEITFFILQEESKHDMFVKSSDAHNLLRPEFIESLWYMYQVTGNKTFQDWGWKIFQSFEKYTKVEGGYTSIGNVNDVNETRPKDMMESFFLSETLKYLFLLFSDNRRLLDIDKFVVNSEGHPLPIYDS